jgi:DNA polymerase III subunit delta'
MLFENVIGQASLKQRLIETVANARIPHAQMFLAPDGFGGLPLALAFAQYILCENKKSTDACGACSSCVKIQKLIHPDVHFSFPVIKKKEKPPVSDDFIHDWREAVLENPYLTVNDWLERIGAENKQGNITADECHAILRKLSLKSFEGKEKILIMWKPEYLGKEGNVLLKLFEEPPEETIIILIAENEDLILKTILSRMQVIRIPPIDDEAIQSALEQASEVSHKKALHIARLSNGNYREALALLSETENSHVALFRSWMLALHDSNWINLYEWIEEMARLGREEQKSFFQYALEFLHQSISLRIRSGLENSLTEEEQRLAEWMAKNFDLMHWEKISLEFDQAYYHIERNANPRMLFMKLSLVLHELIHQKKVILNA